MKNILQLFTSESRKTNVTVMSVLLTLFMIVLYSVRTLYTNDTYYGFLLWNLFLAWLPFIFAYWAYRNYFLGGHMISILLPALFWLLFFPNAPYIITDIVHMRTRSGIPIWFDATMVFCFAFTGFILGLSSLYMIHRMLHHAFASWKSWLMIMLLIAMSGYGIYIGRILRWNSWDIFTSPIPLLHDVHDTILTPSSLAMIAMFSILMGITYPFLFYFVKSTHKK
ncbi:MAG: DUF1361 domain-containing protein [Chitinophagaceae bacterium]|nr:DUF1361 domain-containing protein [Chitinophagaceae bacterium]